MKVYEYSIVQVSGAPTSFYISVDGTLEEINKLHQSITKLLPKETKEDK